MVDIGTILKQAVTLGLDVVSGNEGRALGQGLQFAAKDISGQVVPHGVRNTHVLTRHFVKPPRSRPPRFSRSDVRYRKGHRHGHHS